MRQMPHLKGQRMTGAGAGRLALVLAGFTFLTACEEGQEFNLFDKPLFSGNQSGDEADAATMAAAGTTIERDVEAPEVFEETDQGLWDGRPSLGGVWIAHPNVADPERVIIRNEDNGKFIIGALFRRERENPGPRYQVSSDAAAELGMLAGAPVTLKATAMRREQVVIAPEVVTPAVDALIEPEAIAAEPLETPAQTSSDPVVALAASAIEAATSETPAAQAPLSAITPAPAAAASPAPAPTPAPTRVSSLEKQSIQIGIYSIESNANGTADILRDAGMIPTIKMFKSGDKNYWRVVVGPAANKAERTALIKKVQGLGYSDAFAVTN